MRVCTQTQPSSAKYTTYSSLILRVRNMTSQGLAGYINSRSETTLYCNFMKLQWFYTIFVFEHKTPNIQYYRRFCTSLARAPAMRMHPHSSIDACVEGVCFRRILTLVSLCFTSADASPRVTVLRYLLYCVCAV